MTERYTTPSDNPYLQEPPAEAAAVSASEGGAPAAASPYAADPDATQVAAGPYGASNRIPANRSVQARQLDPMTVSRHAPARYKAAPTVQDRIAGIGEPSLTAAERARARLDAARDINSDYDAGFGGAARGGVMGERFVRGQWEKQAPKQKSPRRLKFWRWFRAIPITLMLLALAISVVTSVISPPALKRFFYPVAHADVIEQAANRYGLDPKLVAAVIKSESNWIDSASSHAGAVGLMQVMPATAQELVRLGYIDAGTYDPNNLSDPATNIAYGTAYLAYLTKTSDSLDQVIAAYNAGPTVSQSWSDVAQSLAQGDFASAITYPETRLYLQKVKDNYATYQELYPNGLSEPTS